MGLECTFVISKTLDIAREVQLKPNSALPSLLYFSTQDARIVSKQILSQCNNARI